ncbi:uncharacterized protein [Lepeophtheirus salmonis]|uniref:uncharacterized protein n=1 Tax=Lepeophtheirus salmonis TaxID=72036 RepID=UPI001AE261DA|nr:ataxin-7-like [Lepeophtheirus salmonis]
MSIHGSLAGQSWSHFHGISGTSTPSHSPRPPSPPPLKSYSCSDDVMKLPARDMHIFGICPSQDDFLLVICEICGKRIKLEAFESHNVARHGSQRQKDARKAMLNDKASALDLIKEDIFNNTPPPPIISNSSSSSTSPSLPQRIKTPVKVEELSNSQPLSMKMEVVEEVAESTSATNNVISIPDNEPLPAGMSKDLMAMVEESSGSLVLPPPPPPPSNSILLPNKTQGSALLSNISNDIVKPSPNKKPRSERRQNSRDREYHPDKHCGVWDNDSKKHCTRALLCKSHSVLLKRKINGRSKSFDELVIEHKAVKEAAALAAKAAASSHVEILQQPSPLPPPPVHNGTLPRIIPTAAVVVAPAAASPLPPPPSSQQQQPIIHQHSPPSEENLFYTTDHPKPLAVCSFGGRRIANTLMTNRSDAFTRKLLRLAYSSQGVIRTNGGGPDRLRILKQQQQQQSTVRRVRTSPSNILKPSPPPQQQIMQQLTASPAGSAQAHVGSSGFLVNYNLSNHTSMNHSLVKIQPGSVSQPPNSSPNHSQQRLSTGIKLSSLQQNIILQDGFKNSTDFSGIQFEFGK